ncbi:MAG: DMT family transporter [Chitinophagaceae bacterium]
MNQKLTNWGLFIVLAFIWGSSFILMKEGLKALSAYEVAAIRMLSAGVVLLPFALKGFRMVKGRLLFITILSGFLGSFIPAILFCLAETRIDSAVAGMLNALTPLFVILVGIVFFRSKVQWKKIAGVGIGFSGMLILVFAKGVKIESTDLIFPGLVLLATFFYGINANMIHHYLKDVGSLQIASIAFVSLILPSLGLLGWTGFFSHHLSEKQFLLSGLASSVLGIFGTAVASILFYMLMKRSGVLFSSMVTYGIPFVAVLWGLIAGESISIVELLGLLIILSGVYITNK